MSNAIRMERITTGAMIPTYDGGYNQESVQKYAWRCPDCGNVWSRKSWAEDCERRKHRMAWVQTYYSGCDPVTGKPTNVRTFIRQVLRRERQAVRATVPTIPAPVSTPAAERQRSRKTHELPYAGYGG